MQTKAIAFDVYGTILCSDDAENTMPPRKGFLEFARKVKESGLILVTSSDSDLTNLRIDLEESGVPLNLFDNRYCLAMRPKDYSFIWEDFGIQPEELFVIGNEEENDLSLAREQGCRTLWVPTYYSNNGTFDFRDVQIP
jgi:FMN phosphatase YigB (HAD superfamily)